MEASKVKSYKTDVNFRTPDFMTIMVSIIAIAGCFYLFRRYKSGIEADKNSIENDWGVVAQDINDSIANWETSRGLPAWQKTYYKDVENYHKAIEAYHREYIQSLKIAKRRAISIRERQTKQIERWNKTKNQPSHKTQKNRRN